MDFKETLWARSSGPRGPWSPEQEFAKDVACLANRRGGVLLVGVAEASGEASSVAPLAKVDREAEERRLRQALVNYQAPVAACEFVWISGAGDQSYLAVVVPRSLRAPHAVVSERGDSRRALRYPERHGTDTVWLTESEVAERYRRRFDAQIAERARLDRVVSDGCEALRVRARSDVWLFVALVPELPVPGRLDNQTVEAIERWHRARSTNSPLNRWISAFGRAIPAPGMVTFTRSQRDRSEDETLIGEAYVELHVDGSAYAALPVREHSTDNPNVRILSDVLLIDDVFLLVDQVLRWSSHQAGAWGVTTLVGGFVESGSGNSDLSFPLSLGYDSGSGSLQRWHGTRELLGAPRFETVADMGAVDTPKQRLAVTYLVASGLLQWFGIAEPAQLRPDGTPVADAYGTSRYYQVRQWGNDNGIDVELRPGDAS